MEKNDNLKKRVTQLEEQLSSTLRAVDKVTADVEVLKDYAIENNKVIKSMLHKLDDHAEQFEKMNSNILKIVEEISADRKLRDAQF